ncbi:MAG TPA: amidohydrolase family protein [Spirochaetota bacterium]
MIIDSHQHAFSDIAAQIALNRSAGLTKSILFPTRVHPEIATSLGEFTREFEMLKRNLAGGAIVADTFIRAIDETADAVAHHPEDFSGFGICPVGMSEQDTAQWIETHITGKGLSGIGEVTFTPGNATSIEPIIRYLHETGGVLPVWVHTFNPATLRDIEDLVSLGVKYPSAKIVLGHGGGYHWLETLSMTKDKPNLWIDLSAQFSVLPVKYFAQEIPDRTLFSSDLPFGDPEIGIVTLRKVISDRSVLEKVLHENAARLIGI